MEKPSRWGNWLEFPWNTGSLLSYRPLLQLLLFWVSLRNCQNSSTKTDGVNLNLIRLSVFILWLCWKTSSCLRMTTKKHDESFRSVSNHSNSFCSYKMRRVLVIRCCLSAKFLIFFNEIRKKWFRDEPTACVIMSHRLLAWRFGSR